MCKLYAHALSRSLKADTPRKTEPTELQHWVCTLHIYIHTHIQLIHEGGYPKNDFTRFPSQAYTVKFPSTPILAELTLKRSPKELRSIDTTSWPTSAATERCWKSRQSLIAEWNHKAKWQWQIRMSITCKPTCNLTDLTQKIQYDMTWVLNYLNSFPIYKL